MASQYLTVVLKLTWLGRLSVWFMNLFVFLGMEIDQDRAADEIAKHIRINLKS